MKGLQEKVKLPFPSAHGRGLDRFSSRLTFVTLMSSPSGIAIPSPTSTSGLSSTSVSLLLLLRPAVDDDSVPVEQVPMATAVA